MGIYANEWLEYVLIIDINSSNTEIILEILRKLFSFPSIKTQGSHKYISIQKCDGFQLLKTKYYNEHKDNWANTYSESLVKIDEKYQNEIILDEKNKIVFDNVIDSNLKDYILDYGWYKYSCVGTTYGDDPIGRHYLQYIAEVNIENNLESIDLFKKKIVKVCELNKIHDIPQLYRQKTDSMIFIKLSELTNDKLYESEYYKHYPLWDLEKYSVGRTRIMNDTKLKFTNCEFNSLNILLTSEIASNIVCHGWYDVYD